MFFRYLHRIILFSIENMQRAVRFLFAYMQRSAASGCMQAEVVEQKFYMPQSYFLGCSTHSNMTEIKEWREKNGGFMHLP
jgi:hypothetical protein